jgi:arginyl-tRNA synthetase
VTTQEDELRAELTRAARAIGAPDDFEPVLERPRDSAFGDWATSAAMVLARTLKKKPRDIAESLIGAIDHARAGISAAEIAGPGFINFRMRADATAAGLASIIAADESYGRNDAGAGEPVVIEFVSANPTGPLHVGHGRQAALGDAIASLLKWTGWTVSREFYDNDAGVQIANLGASVLARIRQLAGHEANVPDGGYHGEYIREIAERYLEQRDETAEQLLARLEGPEAAGASASALLLEELTRFAVAELRKEQDLDLQSFGVRFDTYYLESSLYTDGSVDETVGALRTEGMTYEKDGAVWLKTTEYGDDKDRVMRKSDGTFTYFVPDVAYHVTKWRRGYPRAINVQGADHHSTVTRVRAGLQALGMGIPTGYPEYVLHQMVTVTRAGEEVKISKRAGSYVTVRDLVDEVGRDAVRYFFLMRKGESQLVFDVELAKAQREENPIYYIQMAHARMSGIFRVGEIDPATITGEGVDYALLAEPEEQELIKALLDFPALVTGAAESLEPHRVASYLLETAKLIHLWYHKHHVLNERPEITKARLVLARASRIVIRNGLTILGISAPDRM